MVKLHAPVCSLHASGTFARIANYGKTGPTNWCRAAKPRKNPNTPGQVGVRTMFRFLTKQWPTFAQPSRDTWNDLALAAQITPLNAYCQYNLRRWRRFLGPTVNYPAEETGAICTRIEPFPVALKEDHHVELYSICSAINNNWAIAVFRNPTALYDTHPSNCVAVHLYGTLDLMKWIDPYRTPGTVWYNFRYFTIDGVLGPQYDEWQITF